MSSRKVEQNTFAIPYCTEQRVVGDVLEDGLHFVCPDADMYVYTRKFIDKDFNLACYSVDGLIMNLKITIQYQLIPEKIKTIFFDWGNQEAMNVCVDMIAQSTTRDVCAMYKSDDFYTKRGDIEQMMISNITRAIDNADANVKTGFVQLTNIQLPQQLQSAISNKQLALEEVAIAKNQREQTMIDSMTNLLRTKGDYDIKVIKVNAKANAEILSAKREATARMTTWEKRAEAIRTNIDALGISPEKYLNDYLTQRLNADIIDPKIKTCLMNSNQEISWWCWINPSTISVAP